MKKRLLLWGCLLMLALPAWAKSPPDQADQHTNLHTYTLDNGMPVFVKTDNRAPTAVHMLWMRVGSIDEVNGKTGVAHVLEHMMFKGTPTVPAGEFSRQIAALGGEENAFTARDYTSYFQQIPADRIEEVMKLESDRFVNNSWPDGEFEREVRVVQEERRMRVDDRPRALLREVLMATAFMAHPYRRPIIGWMNDLENLTADDVRAFYKTWYDPANAALVVAGDVDPEQVYQLAEKYYGGLAAAQPVVRKPQVEPEQLGVKSVVVKAPAEQPYLSMAYRVPKFKTIDDPQASDREALALTVLSAILDGNDGARFERHLIQTKDRVADAASAGNGFYGRGPQLFYVEGVPAEGRTIGELQQALQAEIKRVAEAGVSDAELRRVKNQWIASEVYQQDAIFSQARQLGAYWALGFPPNTRERLIELLRTVTAEEVQAVAKKYFTDDRLTAAVLEPQARASDDKKPAQSMMIQQEHIR